MRARFRARTSSRTHIVAQCPCGRFTHACVNLCKKNSQTNKRDRITRTTQISLECIENGFFKRHSIDLAFCRLVEDLSLCPLHFNTNTVASRGNAKRTLADVCDEAEDPDEEVGVRLPTRLTNHKCRGDALSSNEVLHLDRLSRDDHWSLPFAQPL